MIGKPKDATIIVKVGTLLDSAEKIVDALEKGEAEFEGKKLKLTCEDRFALFGDAIVGMGSAGGLLDAIGRGDEFLPRIKALNERIRASSIEFATECLL